MTDSRAMVLTAYGQPLALQPRDVGEPRRGEVLLKVKATSCNYHDLVGVMGGIPRLLGPAETQDFVGLQVAMYRDLAKRLGLG